MNPSDPEPEPNPAPSPPRLTHRQKLVFLLALGYVLARVLSHRLGTWPLRDAALNSALLYAIVIAAAVGIVKNARRRWPHMLLAAATTLVCLGMCEIILRIALPYDSLSKYAGISSPLYHHFHKLNTRVYVGLTEEGRFTINTNEDGFRTDRTRKEFLDHKTRIAVLGDSFVFGLHTVAENALPARLEVRLREKLNTKDLAVLNTGVLSFSPFLEKKIFDGIVKDYKPTLTLLYLDATDIADDYFYELEYNVDDPGHDPPKHPGAFYDRRNEEKGYYGATYKLIVEPMIVDPLRFPWEHLFKSQRYNWGSNTININGKTESRWFIYRYPRSVTDPFFNRTWKHVREIAQSVRASGSEFVFFVTPRFQHWNPKECPNNWEGDQYTRNEPYQFEYLNYFEEHQGEADFRVKSLLPEFQATKEFPLVISSDPHWNSHGHDFVARVTADYLIREKLVP